MMKDSNLLFIISQPRSGSTLLHRILSNSPDISSIKDESWILLPFLSIHRPDLNQSLYGSDLASQAIKNSLNDKVLRDFLRDFIIKLYSESFDNPTKFILDKTPRYYEIIDEIIDYFPNAKIIVLKRNPLDVVFSFHERWPRKRLIDIAHFGRDIFTAPLKIDAFLNSHQSNENVKVVKYEELVKTPVEILSRLFQWLDIKFEKSYLKYDRQEIPLLGDNKINHINYPHDVSIDRWKKSVEDKGFRGFISGYINYLISNGYEDYSLPSFPNSQNWRFNTIFKYFLVNSTSRGLTFSSIFDRTKIYLMSKFL